MTVRELQRLLDADLRHCYALLCYGRIVAEKVNGNWWVDRASAESYARKRTARLNKRQEKKRRRADRRAARAAEDQRWRERLASVR